MFPLPSLTCLRPARSRWRARMAASWCTTAKSTTIGNSEVLESSQGDTSNLHQIPRRYFPRTSPRGSLS
jgi:hypothetical protein